MWTLASIICWEGVCAVMGIGLCKPWLSMIDRILVTCHELNSTL
jgi:hypothetical protein